MKKFYVMFIGTDRRISCFNKEFNTQQEAESYKESIAEGWKPFVVESVEEDESKYNFPEAEHWMWNYCTFLGKFTSSNGTKFDLGVYEGVNDTSFSIVYGNKDGDYISGPITYYGTSEECLETIRRWEAYNKQ